MKYYTYEQQPTLKHLLAIDTNFDTHTIALTTAVNESTEENILYRDDKFNESCTISLYCSDHLKLDSMHSSHSSHGSPNCSTDV